MSLPIPPLRPRLHSVAAARVVAGLAALGVVGVLAASPASATVTAFASDSTLSINSDAAGDVLQMSCSGGNVQVGMALFQPCTELTDLTVNASGGSDTVNLGNVGATQFPALTGTRIRTGGDGVTDVVVGSQLADRVTADADDTVTAGSGDDYVEEARTADGGDGDDTLVRIQESVDGGPGDDVVYNPGAGPFAGGTGTDTLRLDYVDIDAAGAGLDLTLTASTLDVAIPGQGSQSLPTTGFEVLDAVMPAGIASSTVDARSFPGRIDVAGLDGVDVIRSGTGRDALDGGPGADRLFPGGGSDTVRGGRDADVIEARDGVVDLVDCGSGVDTVVADRADLLVGCETVRLPPPATGAVSGPGRIAKGTTGRFTFTGTAGASFQCRIDAKAYRSCRSPFTLATRKLSKGRHTLTVRAVLPAGNPDPSPSVKRFRVF